MTTEEDLVVSTIDEDQVLMTVGNRVLTVEDQVLTVEDRVLRVPEDQALVEPDLPPLEDFLETR